MTEQEFADWLEQKQAMRDRQLYSFDQIVTHIQYARWNSSRTQPEV